MASTLSTEFAHLRIPLEVIVVATKNFHPDYIISQGEFGAAYKGRLLHSGKLIKIIARRFDRKPRTGDVEFWTEISALSDLKHKNIVSIIGYCDEKNVKIIITTYESNGSLDAYLNSPNLTWTQRLRISIGVAHALSYLHHDTGRDYGFIHRNINSYTILLDENWEAKLSCFEICIKQSVNQTEQFILSVPIGTIGYTDPKVEMTGCVTHNSDIYSLGVILFELLCGREAFIHEANSFLAPLAKYHYESNKMNDIIYPVLGNQMSPQSLFDYSDIAYACLEEEPAHRPNTSTIVKQLEMVLELHLRRQNMGKKLEHMKIPLTDIKLATNDFSKTCTYAILNYCALYRVELNHFDKENPSSVEGKKEDEHPKRRDTVLIKRYPSRHHLFGEEQFFTEIEMLTSVKHPNIATLLGFCVEGFEMILVIENVSNGYLGVYLRNINDTRRILTWEKRLKICIDVANALNYLHFEMEDQKTIINRVIQCFSVILDENMRAKIVDFWYSVYLPPNQEVLYVNSDVGRMYSNDPEYENTGKLKRETDVYSFGVLLFEILCGRTADDPIYLKENAKGLALVAKRCFSDGTLENMIDPLILEENGGDNFVLHRGPNKDSLDTFINIAYKCVAETQDQRPTMKAVFQELEKALIFQEQVRCQNVDQAVDRPQKLLENQEQEQRHNVDQVVDRPQKILENKGHNWEYLKIRLSDIMLATENFSDRYKIPSWDAYVLYRAELGHFNKENHSMVEGEHPKRDNIVVIKRYPRRHDLFTEEAFFTEIEMLTSVKHPNIVTLLGFCVECSEKILVTENVSNGYLESYLGNFNTMSILTWEKRLIICIDVARALNYLHFEMEDQKMIVNRKISSGNIGLDENWGAKISDFVISVYLSANQDDNVLNLEAIGSPSYIDPEYKKTGKLKRESDVYSFGVVLFEILCGRKSFDPIYKESDTGLASVARRKMCEGTLEYMIDPTIKEETGENKFLLNRGPNKDSLRTFIEIAHQCITETQEQRPSMKVVVKELERALFFHKNNNDNPTISLEDIKLATNNFHDKNYIGGGGFGGVYKGNLQDGDEFKTIVAKRLNKEFGQGEQQFFTELQILLEYKHENVIGLVGYCDEEDEKIIVYEYAPRGSLDKYYNHASLTWVNRLSICIDVASALHFLHGGVGKQAKVIHRDIKTANILINHDWKAKLADFGLSLISPLIQETDYVIDHVCGTCGYLDPLYRESGFLTVESDIYSFGVVLFEILYGRSTNSIKKHVGEFLSSFVKNKFEEGKLDDVVFDPIRKEIEPKSLFTFQQIAYQCLHPERKKRPSAIIVLTQLKKALEYQNMKSTILTNFDGLQIPLEDVVKATDNFHHDNTIGHDVFCTTYSGQLLQSGRLMNIAARRFDCNHEEGDLKFLTEISVLSKLQHTNIVYLIGFCDEKDEKIIVTTYEANGSLGQHLKSPDLSWTKRLKIGVGVARALNYLLYDEGRDYAIIHCNINSNTILLDENWEAKLSGFEYSIKQLVCDKYEVCFCEHIDTTGCMDPAIEKTGGVTQMSDNYSLGVVLFEILCGRKAVMQNTANRFLAPLAKYHCENETLLDIVHPDLYWNHMSPQSFLKLSSVAYSCLNEDRAQRPDMDIIVEELEKALELQLQVEIKIENLKHLKIPLRDIKIATNNFSETYMIASWDLSTWYKAELDLFNKQSTSGKNKGKHPEDNNTVVMKRYPFGHEVYGEEAFFTEIEMLTIVKHPNIVALLGFCIEGFELIVVTENVSNGYLGHDYLGNVNRMRILTWEKRLRICIDVALALNYLHSEMEDQKMIINRDINSKNIVLDENFGAKIVDFWFSVCLPSNQEDETLYLNKYVGRRSYIDPIFAKTGKLTRKSDVYSFGVLLFEILCDKGLLPVIHQHFCTEKVAEMIDPIIKEEAGKNTFFLNRGPNKDSLHSFIKIAQQCVSEDQIQRPMMNVVVKKLKEALFIQENKDNYTFPLEDIKQATQNFHDNNCLGGRGFKKVYKGNLHDGEGVTTIVANRYEQGEKQFLRELQVVWEYKHKNVIGLVGYCNEQDEKIIVYEYASRESLDRYLNDASLTWMQRLNICIDIASALDFIHEGVKKQARVIHRDIKAANILLSDDWKAKLAGFGLSLISPINQESNYVIDRVCGTSGYLDPLYTKFGFLTIESDIYSFGVVLFEILCGRSTFATHKHEGHYLPDFIKNKFEEGKHEEVVFDQIREQIVPESLTAFQEIAYQCLHHEREKRPTAEEVLIQLQMALAFQISKGE